MTDATALPLINAALTRTGNDPITEINDGSAGGVIDSENYEELTNGLLRESLYQISAFPHSLDPQRSLASTSCCSSEAGFSPYQSTRLSGYHTAP